MKVAPSYRPTVLKSAQPVCDGLGVDRERAVLLVLVVVLNYVANLLML